MKAEFKIDHREVIEEIKQTVVKALKPFIREKGSEDNLFSVKTLAEYLGVTKDWVYKKIQFQGIPYIKKGGLLRFRKSAIDQWLDEGNVPARKPQSRNIRVLK